MFDNTDYIKMVHGSRVTYFDDNTIESECLCDENGMRQGTYVLYFDNGNVHILASYQDDRLHGVYYVYDRDGIEIESSNYINGNLDVAYYFRPIAINL